MAFGLAIIVVVGFSNDLFDHGLNLFRPLAVLSRVAITIHLRIEKGYYSSGWPMSALVMGPCT